MEPVIIVCMKWGNKFGPEYVNNLYHMVKRNITLPFRFVCMTEIHDGIENGVFRLAARLRRDRACIEACDPCGKDFRNARGGAVCGHDCSLDW